MYVQRFTAYVLLQRTPPLVVVFKVVSPSHMSLGPGIGVSDVEASRSGLPSCAIAGPGKTLLSLRNSQG